MIKVKHYDPEILLLGVYVKELKIRAQTNVSTPVFIAYLSEPKCGNNPAIHQQVIK